MAVPEQIPVVNYVADGVVKKFDVPFEYDQQSDLHLYVDGVEPTIDKYFFEDNAFNFYIAPTIGQDVKIKRITPKERDTDYDLHTNTVRPTALNGDFDRLWYVLQEVFSDVGGLSQAVQDEIIARIQGDEDLLNQLTAEISARMLGDESVTEDLKNYVNQVVGAIIGDPSFTGIDAKNVNDASGESQQQVNYNGGSKWHSRVGGYKENERAVLANGDIVKSTVDGNTNDPNVNMSGWEKDGGGATTDGEITTWSGRTQESKNKDQISPYDYLAAGDGVTNDTAKFKEIEATETTKTQIDLAGGTYAITSPWVDPLNGVTLTKDYINGTLLVDGRKLVFDKTQGFAASSASVNRLGQASTNKSLGIKRNSENEYEVWRPLGGHYWARMVLRRTANNIPLNWQETRIKQVLGYVCAEDGNTYSGTWATLDGVSGLSDGSGNLFVGGRARQAQAAGDYVEIPYTGGGDIYVLFAGRTSGNYVNVLLDNAKDYLVLPDDGSGNKYFDSYTALDLQYKQLVKIATGVPSGNHVIRLTVSSLKNAASTGGRFVFNALSFDGADVGPWRSQTDAKVWKTGELILLNQVRKYGANYYYATVAGTTGATPPTHTSGAISDGGVTWTYRAITSYDLVDSAIQVAGSQLEYAYEMKPLGATTKEDVGGALHGNEVQTALSIFVGNNKATLLDNTWLTGDLISFKEENYSTHSQIGGGATPVVKTSLVRTFKRQWVEMYHKHVMQMQVELGYFYPHMYPLLHYHGASNKYAVRKFWSPGDGDRKCSDFYNQSNPFVGRTKDTLMIAYGDCLQPNGSGGVPTTQTPPLQFSAWLSIDPSSVDSYDSADSLFAAKAMNTSGADVSMGGYSSMTSKMYFERYSNRNPRTLAAGDSFECFARYGLDLIQN